MLMKSDLLQRTISIRVTGQKRLGSPERRRFRQRGPYFPPPPRVAQKVSHLVLRRVPHPAFHRQGSVRFTWLKNLETGPGEGGARSPKFSALEPSSPSLLSSFCASLAETEPPRIPQVSIVPMKRELRSISESFRATGSSASDSVVLEHVFPQTK